MKTDFISIADHQRDWIENTFELADAIKTRYRNGETYQPLRGKTLAMIFQKPSARTRVSFETGMYKLGGHALYLSPSDIGLGKREATSDLGQLFSRYNDGIMARVFGHEIITELASSASVPVINGLSDYNHPCQIMADFLTIKEHLGRLEDFKFVFVGDGNNVANSFINLASKFPFHLVIACPKGYEPDAKTLKMARAAQEGEIEINNDPQDAVRNADVIYTDVWASMGQEDEQKERLKAFTPFQVNKELFSIAKPECKFMHCLPAHRGDEVTSDVIDSPNSIIFDEAENRMHAQNAILVNLLG